MRDRDLLNVQGHERVGLLSVLFAVIKQDLFTAHNYILQRKRKTGTNSVNGNSLNTCENRSLDMTNNSGNITFLSQPNRFVFLERSEIQPSSLESNMQKNKKNKTKRS